MLKNEVSEVLCMLCSNVERSAAKSQLFFNFKRIFHSQAKGNPRVVKSTNYAASITQISPGHKWLAGHILCGPELVESCDCMLEYSCLFHCQISV
jgi:hypothetical protein